MKLATKKTSQTFDSPDLVQALGRIKRNFENADPDDDVVMDELDQESNRVALRLSHFVAGRRDDKVIFAFIQWLINGSRDPQVFVNELMQEYACFSSS